MLHIGRLRRVPEARQPRGLRKGRVCLHAPNKYLTAQCKEARDVVM